MGMLYDLQNKMFSDYIWRFGYCWFGGRCGRLYQALGAAVLKACSSICEKWLSHDFEVEQLCLQYRCIRI